MNHSDVIKKILSTEQQAKKIITEAESKKANFDADLDESIQKMRRAAEQKAMSKIEAFRKESDANLGRDMKKLDAHLKQAMDKFEKLYKDKESTWVNKLLSVIIDDA